MMVFSSDFYEENRSPEEELIRLVPFGLTLNIDPTRPTLILKDESQKHTLPVTLNPLEAGITLGQNNQALPPATPHRLMQMLLESLSIKITRAVFVEIKGHYQYLRLTLDGHPSHGSLKIRADEVMSLCIHFNIPLFASPKFLEKSKMMNAELEGLAKGAKDHPAMMNRTSEYLM